MSRIPARPQTAAHCLVCSNLWAEARVAKSLGTTRKWLWPLSTDKMATKTADRFSKLPYLPYSVGFKDRHQA
ncbi:hypothetical protein BDY19DRAFT_1042375, partial [Irpex rosettiformis]